MTWFARAALSGGALSGGAASGRAVLRSAA
jgi:hypothetical protein